MTKTITDEPPLSTQDNIEKTAIREYSNVRVDAKLYTTEKETEPEDIRPVILKQKQDLNPQRAQKQEMPASSQGLHAEAQSISVAASGPKNPTFEKYYESKFPANYSKFVRTFDIGKTTYSICVGTTFKDNILENVEWSLWDNSKHIPVCGEDFNLVIRKDLFKFFSTLDERNNVKKLIKEKVPSLDLTKSLLRIAENMRTNFPNLIIEYEDFDDIELPHEDEIAPISFVGLPRYNYIHEFVELIKASSHTYPEYSFQNGLFAMSTVARRRLYFHMDLADYYTNGFWEALGPSGTAKSPVCSINERIINKALGPVFLSYPGSIQALRLEMADEIYSRVKNEWEITERGTDLYDIRRALCPLMLDEAGTFHAMLNKEFSEGEKDFINELYGCPENLKDKIIVNKRIVTREVYFLMNLFTTKSVFLKHLNEADVLSGSYPRYNILAPEYEFVVKGHTQEDNTDFLAEEALIHQIKLIDQLLPSKPVKFGLNQECFELYDKWSTERHQYFLNQKNDIMSAFWGKFQITVIKVAALIELGNLTANLCEYYRQNAKLEDTITLDNRYEKSKDTLVERHKVLASLNLKGYKIKSFDIGMQSLKYAMSLYDNQYLKYHSKLFDSIVENDKLTPNQKFLKLIKDRKKIYKRDVQRSIVAKVKDITEWEQMLKEIGEITLCTVKKFKPKTVYLHTPQSTRAYPFKCLITINPDETNNAKIILSNKDNLDNSEEMESASEKTNKINCIIETVRTENPSQTDPEQLKFLLQLRLRKEKINVRPKRLEKLIEIYFSQSKKKIKGKRNEKNMDKH